MGDQADAASPDSARASRLNRAASQALLGAPWIHRRLLDEAFAVQFRGDRIGHRLHTIFAAAFLLCVGGPTSIAEIAAVPLVVFYLVRTKNIWRTWLWSAAQPAFLLIAAWAAWQGLSLLWSSDPPQGLDEMGALRWAVPIMLLYPVIDKRRTLLAFYAAGLLAGVGAQVWDIAMPWLGLEHWGFGRAAARHSGWWDPVVGGSILCGALGLHLPAALWGQGRTRALGVACSAVTLLGILATGTRGAWLAGAGLVAFAVATAAWRVRPRRRLLWPALASVGAVALLVAAATLTVGSSVSARFTAAVRDVRGAFERRDFTSDTGARLLMNWWAIEAFAAHPAAGVGAGGYAAWVREHLRGQGIDPATRPVHAHAHSAPLHIAATTGAVGLALCGGILAAGLAAAGKWGRIGRAINRASGRSPASTREASTSLPGPDSGIVRTHNPYDSGPLLALIGLTLAGAFDAVHLNAQTAAQFGVLLALSPAVVPSRVTG